MQSPLYVPLSSCHPSIHPTHHSHCHIIQSIPSNNDCFSVRSAPPNCWCYLAYPLDHSHTYSCVTPPHAPFTHSTIITIHIIHVSLIYSQQCSRLQSNSNFDPLIDCTIHCRITPFIFSSFPLSSIHPSSNYYVAL
jgi:hypothetical protein